MALPQGPFYQQLGRSIRAVRLQKPLTQQQLALAAGVSRASVVNIERGRQPVYIHVLLKISDALGVTLTALLAPTVATPAELPAQIERLGAAQQKWVERILSAPPPEETNVD